MKGIEVPIGGLVSIDGIVYECRIEVEQGGCFGCDLFHRVCYDKLICVGYSRKDRQGVIFKEVME